MKAKAWPNPMIHSTLVQPHDAETLTLRLGMEYRHSQTSPCFTYRLPRDVARVLLRELQEVLR